MSTTRPRGFAAWNPRAGTVQLLRQIDTVLHEYADYLPLTCRQVFYRLVGAHGYDKTERSYSRLCETMGRARRASYVSLDSIRDDGMTRLAAKSASETLERSAANGSSPPIRTQMWLAQQSHHLPFPLLSRTAEAV